MDKTTPAKAMTYRQTSADPEDIPQGDKHSTLSVYDVRIMHDVRLQIAICPPDKKDDIRYCLQNCAQGDGIIALVNSINITITASKDPQHKQTSTIKQPDISRETRPEPFVISSDQLTEEQLEQTTVGDFLRGKIIPQKSRTLTNPDSQKKHPLTIGQSDTLKAGNYAEVNPTTVQNGAPPPLQNEHTTDSKNNTCLDVTSNDHRMEKAYGPVIKRHVQKFYSLNKPAENELTGSIIARSTPGGMEMVDGILHYVEIVNSQSAQEKPAKPHRKPDESNKSRIIIAPFNLDQLSLNDVLLKAKSIISDLTHHSDQEYRDNDLDTSLKSIFKQLSQRKKADLAYRKKLKEKFKELTGKPEEDKEKTLLFLLDEGNTILGRNHNKFLTRLYKTLDNTHKNEKPDRIVLLTAGNSGRLEYDIKTFRLKEALKAFEKMINIAYTENQDNPLIKCKTNELNDKFIEINRTINMQPDFTAWASIIGNLIPDYERFYLVSFHTKNPPKVNSKYVEMFIKIDQHLWSILNELTLLLFSGTDIDTNTNNATLLVGIITTALLIKKDKENKRPHTFKENRDLMNTTFETLFTNIKLDFNDSNLLNISASLLKHFFAKKYFFDSVETLQKEDKTLNLKIIISLIENINEEYMHVFSEENISKNTQASKKKLSDYIVYLQGILTCYNSFKTRSNDPIKNKLVTIIDKLALMYSNLVDQDLLGTPSIPKNTKKRKTKKQK